MPRKKSQGENGLVLSDKGKRDIDRPKWIEEVYQLLLDGQNRYQVMADFSKKIGKGETYVRDLITDAYKLGSQNINKDKDYIFALHIDRYEEMYRENMLMVNRYGQPLDRKTDWAEMNAKYYNAMKALKSKEQLLGLHDKKFSIEIQNNKATLVQTEQETRGKIEGVDLDVLSFEEMIDLLRLLKSARKHPIEGVQEVIMRQRTVTTTVEISESKGYSVKIKTKEEDERETMDIIHEELPKEKVVEQIVVDQPIEQKEIHEIDKLIKEKGKKMKDVARNIQQKDLEMFASLIKKKKQKE